MNGMLTTSETTAAITAPKAADRSATAATAASDFQSFLRLLTAQLRHQDPLSPLESTQFVQQLASFSAVEQQIETNKLLRELTSGATKSGLEGATLWIGKEVETPVSAVRFSGAPLEFRIGQSATGATGEAVVKNASGAVVYREALQPGQSTFEWNGASTDGAGAPYGDYKVAVEYAADGGAVESKPVSVVARVTEARLADGVLNLVLDNGAVIDPSTITAVRDAKASDVLPGDV